MPLPQYSAHFLLGEGFQSPPAHSHCSDIVFTWTNTSPYRTTDNRFILFSNFVRICLITPSSREGFLFSIFANTAPMNHVADHSFALLFNCFLDMDFHEWVNRLKAVNGRTREGTHFPIASQMLCFIFQKIMLLIVVKQCHINCFFK